LFARLPARPPAGAGWQIIRHAKTITRRSPRLASPELGVLSSAS
jgi:hypothetical protein